MDEQQPVPLQQEVSWTIESAKGPLALAYSETEYAVYDLQLSYGRWPRTEQGHQLAIAAFGAQAQSPAHGLAYAATGYQDPVRLGLPTDPTIKSKSYSSPLSYIGSTRRIVAWATKAKERSPNLAVLVWVAAAFAMLWAWLFITGWYVLIFGVFGIFVIPYRLIRRSQRKSHHVQSTTLATQQAMYQQMVAAQQGAPQPYAAPMQSSPVPRHAVGSPPPPAVGPPPSTAVDPPPSTATPPPLASPPPPA